MLVISGTMNEEISRHCLAHNIYTFKFYTLTCRNLLAWHIDIFIFE